MTEENKIIRINPDDFPTHLSPPAGGSAIIYDLTTGARRINHDLSEVAPYVERFKTDLLTFREVTQTFAYPRDAALQFRIQALRNSNPLEALKLAAKSGENPITLWLESIRQFAKNFPTQFEHYMKNTREYLAYGKVNPHHVDALIALRENGLEIKKALVKFGDRLTNPKAYLEPPQLRPQHPVVRFVKDHCTPAPTTQQSVNEILTQIRHLQDEASDTADIIHTPSPDGDKLLCLINNTTRGEKIDDDTRRLLRNHGTVESNDILSTAEDLQKQLIRHYVHLAPLATFAHDYPLYSHYLGQARATTAVTQAQLQRLTDHLRSL